MAKPGNPTPFFSNGLPTPVPVVTRPLLGLDWLSSSLNAPDGALLDAKNILVRPKGLYRIPGYEAFMNGDTWSPTDNPCLLEAAWGTNGVQYPYLFTENYVFLCDWFSGYVRKEWLYDVGTVDVSSTAVGTASGTTLWKTLGIQPGDVITIGGSDYEISEVLSDTEIRITTDGGTQSGVAYSISRKLHAGDPYLIDACEVQDISRGSGLIAVTFRNQILFLDPTTGVIENLTPTVAKQPSTGGFTAECVAYFVGRVFAAHLDDGTNGELRAFIRWSKTTDIGDFSEATAYTQLMDQGSKFSGAVRRMIPLGAGLICYLDDAIFVGTPSNQPGLPLSFQQIPTGRIGLVGTRAVASLVLPSAQQGLGPSIAGHFFVGRDNVYFLSASTLAIEAIGNKIVRDSVLKCQLKTRIQTSVDWSRRRIRFGFPIDDAFIENIFDFDWETKEWSYESRTTWLMGDPFLSQPLVSAVMVTETGNPVIATTGWFMVAPWSDVPLTVAGQYIEQSGALWASLGLELDSNPDGSANAIAIETVDYDEGAPGMVKFWRMLRIKIGWDTAPAVPIVFTVSLSTDCGRTWKSAGTMSIAIGSDEGYVNFRATGPHIRFKITSSTVVTPYYITEMSRLVAIRAVQQSLRQQRALP